MSGWVWHSRQTGWTRVGPIGWVYHRRRLRALSIGIGRFGRTWNFRGSSQEADQ